MAPSMEMPITYYGSRLRFLFPIILIVVYFIWGILMFAGGDAYEITVGIMFVIAAGLLSIKYVQRYVPVNATLIIDSRGIFDRRIMSEPIPWRDVIGMHEYSVGGGKFIVLAAENAERYAVKSSRLRHWFYGIGIRPSSTGYHIWLDTLRPDKKRGSEVVSLRKQRPAAINAGDSSGRDRRAKTIGQEITEYAKRHGVSVSALDSQAEADSPAPGSRLWTLTKLVFFALLIPALVALSVEIGWKELFFDCKAAAWQQFEGRVTDSRVLKRRAGRSLVTKELASFTIQGNPIRFVVKEDEPRYTDLFIIPWMASNWIGSKIKVTVLKSEYDESYKNRLLTLDSYLKEARIWALERNGRSVIALEENCRYEEDDWPSKMIAILFCFMFIAWAADAVLENWLTLRGRRI